MKNFKENIELEEKVVMNILDVTSGSYETPDKILLSKEELEIYSEFNNILSLLPAAAKQKTPSPNVKENLLNKINSMEEKIESRSGFDFIYEDKSDWIQHPIEGIKFKTLAHNKEKGYVMLLMKVAGGTFYPAHSHSGAEECYVIEGDLYAQGKILGPGDFHHADSTINHEPLYSKNGCTVILVVDEKDV